MTTIAQVKGSAPIFTSGAAVTNAAISISYPVANAEGTQQGWYCEVQPFADAADFVNPDSSILSWSATNRPLYKTGSGQFIFRSNQISFGPAGTPGGAFQKVGVAVDYTPGNQVLNVDGTEFDEKLGTVTPLTPVGQIKALSGNVTTLPQLIRNIRRYDLPYADAKAKIVELMAPPAVTVMQNGTLTTGRMAQSHGYLRGSYGALAPDETTDNFEVRQLTVANNTGLTTFRVEGLHPQDDFTSMEIVSIGTLLSANAASYNFDGVDSIWTWATAFALVDTTVYAVEFA